MEDNLNKILFEEVNGSQNQILILYSLLKKRKYKISHDNLPSFDEHKKFVLNNPYLKWFIIYNNETEYGTFYIKKDNSIGLNLLKNEKRVVKNIIDYVNLNFTPNKFKPSEIPSYFYFNISILNIGLRNILKEIGKQSFQISYKL